MSLTYDSSNRNTRVGREVAVMALVPAPLSGTSGTSVSFIGIYETFTFKVMREFGDTTGSADQAKTSRALRWGDGSVTLNGFTRGTSSAMAAIFAANSHVILLFQEVATGDTHQLMCTCKEYEKALGKEANKDTLSLGQEGIPFFGAAGATPTAMALEA